MGWVDREHIPALQQDWRYDRLFSLSRRLLEQQRVEEQERRVPKCSNCQGGQITVRDADGNETTVTCGACGGSGEVGSPADNEDNGQASGGR
jgi:hypothetical protein